MRGKDLKTLESLLKEYGMQSGTSTPVGQQTSGSSAKASAANRASKSAINKPSQSPSTQKTTQVKTAEPAQPVIAKAKELEQDFEFPDDKGNVVKVVSPMGQGLNKDAVIVQNQKNKEFYTLQPDDDIALPQVDQEEVATEDNNALAKVKSHKLRTGKKGNRKVNLGRKVKKLSKLIRNHRLSEAPLFEINFNDPKLAKSALASSIACGFEAETVWNNVEGRYPGDDDDWLVGASWRYVQDHVYDQEGARSVEEIEESYRQWLQESDEFYDINSDVIQEMVRERKEDENYLNDFVDDEIDQDDVEEYKERTIAQLEGDKDDGNEEAADELEEREGWDDAAWGREYVEENKDDELEEWLSDKIRDNGEDWDETWDRATDRYDIDYWCERVYGGNWYSALMDHEIYLVNPEGEGGGVTEVAEQFIEPWAQKNSEFNDVRAGGYHDSYGDTSQDYWRVEDDSSISGNGAGAEIISPVYGTPEKMLKEMKSLFEYMEQNDADTNSSTGLHITMSWNGEEGAETNRLKMALLLGDQYVAQQFNRENNTYAQSQYKKIQEYLQNLKTNINDEKSLEDLEKILNNGISPDKFRTIHFKDAKNENSNNLIEFRVAGGRDYHADYNKIVKTVIRYAAIMQAGHDTNAYRRDYIKAIFRAISGKQNVDQLGTPEQLPAAPIVDVAKDLVGQKYYSDVLEALMAAYQSLKTAKQMQAKDPQKDLFGEAEGDAETLTGPEWAKHFFVAKEQLAKAFTLIAASTASGQNRNKINARAISVFRNTLKEFGMDYKQLWDEVKNTMVYRKFISGNSVTGHNTLKSGFDKMFRAEVGQEKKASFKLDYTPSGNDAIPAERQDVLLPTPIYNALKQAGIARTPLDDDIKVDPQAARPALKAEDFIIINSNEFEKVRRQRYEKEATETEIEQEKELIKVMIRNIKDGTNRNAESAKEAVRSRQERVAEMEAEVMEYNTDLNAFMKKYGFIPPSIKHGSEFIGKSVRRVNSDQMSNIIDEYNIEVNSMESVFTKINKLSLEEQLKFVNKIDEAKLNEAWSKKYKDSINCSNPKGFSQKAHCAGKKKKTDEAWFKKKEKAKVKQTDPVKVIMNIASSGKEWPVRMNDGNHVVVTPDIAKVIARRYYASNTFKDMIAKAFRSVESFTNAIKNLKPAPVKEGAVPNNDRAKKIQEILSKPLLASDLRGQMNAYIAVPDPSMIRAFRQARAQGGDSIDLREVFKTFANSVHPTIKKQAGLKESTIKEAPAEQERLKFIVDQLKKNPEFINRVYRFIKTDAKNSERVHPADFLTPDRTEPERDYAYKGVLQEFINAIMNTDGDFDDIENFLATYGKVSYVNTKVLMADGYSTWDQWLQGSGKVSKEFISELYDNMFNIALNIEGSNRGPGEVGLALLAPNITFASVGDLKIDGEEVEVKGEKSSGGGRLKNSNADYGQPNLDAVYDKFKIPAEARPQRLPAGNAGSRAGTHFLDIAQQLDAVAPGAGKEYIKELFTATFKYGDKSMINYMIKNYSTMDRAQASELAQEISYSSYANILKGKGFSKFLFLKAPGKKTLAFDVDDYKNHLDKFKLGSLDWGDKQNGPAVQVSMR